jgi:hypothetical protein
MQPSDSSHLPRRLHLIDFPSWPCTAEAGTGEVRSPRFRRLPFMRNGVSDRGRAVTPCITVHNILPSTLSTASASARLNFSRLNIPLHMIAVYASRPSSPAAPQHLLEGGSLLPYPHRTFTGWKAPASPGARSGREPGCPGPTGSSGVVTHPRLPQNVACRFAALRSSGVGSQYCESLQRLVGQPQLWSQQSPCYSFESCFHGWFIFSLHRSPDLSLDRAHVSHEQFIFCWPLPHVAGSPDRGVLSASLTSTRPSDLPRLASLSGPTGFRLNLMDLPCSHEILWLHAGGTNPGSFLDAHRVVPGNTAFPIER